MKLGILIIALILAPELAFAEETAAHNVDLNAFVHRSQAAADENLYAEINYREPMETGIIRDWRERVYKTLTAFSRPSRSDLTNDSRLQSASEFDERTNDGRMVSKVVLKETLKFAQERLPEIDKLVKIMRFEVSTDMLSENGIEAEVGESKFPEPRASRQTSVEDRLFVKTGLRIPVEGGKLNLLSETEAKYGNVSSYFRVYLGGQNDSRLGLVYVLSRDMQVNVERQVNHNTDASTGDKTKSKANVNLIQLVCAF